MQLRFASLVLVLLSAAVCLAEKEVEERLLGRWDLVMAGADGEFPSWMEVRKSGNSTLVGSFVGQFGSARPVAKIEKKDDGFVFTIPPQWEERDTDLTFRFRLDGDRLVGATTDEEARSLKFRGSRAPSLERDDAALSESDPVELFNGKDLDGWTVQLKDVPNGWIVRDGLLYNEKPGNNLVSKATFDDFKLVAEFRYPEGSNSGIYLRGRYELQIEDNHGGAAANNRIGAVYGHITPSLNAAKKAGEWQRYEVTLIGRKITVHLNGKRVVDRQTIPGITGGALDSDEGKPGPIMIQGDHGQVEFRKLTVMRLEQ